MPTAAGAAAAAAAASEGNTFDSSTNRRWGAEGHILSINDDDTLDVMVRKVVATRQDGYGNEEVVVEEVRREGLSRNEVRVVGGLFLSHHAYLEARRHGGVTGPGQPYNYSMRPGIERWTLDQIDRVVQFLSRTENARTAEGNKENAKAGHDYQLEDKDRRLFDKYEQEELQAERVPFSSAAFRTFLGSKLFTHKAARKCECSQCVVDGLDNTKEMQSILDELLAFGKGLLESSDCTMAAQEIEAIKHRIALDFDFIKHKLQTHLRMEDGDGMHCLRHLLSKAYDPACVSECNHNRKDGTCHVERDWVDVHAEARTSGEAVDEDPYAGQDCVECNHYGASGFFPCLKCASMIHIKCARRMWRFPLETDDPVVQQWEYICDECLRDQDGYRHSMDCVSCCEAHVWLMQDYQALVEALVDCCRAKAGAEREQDWRNLMYRAEQSCLRHARYVAHKIRDKCQGMAQSDLLKQLKVDGVLIIRDYWTKLKSRKHVEMKCDGSKNKGVSVLGSCFIYWVLSPAERQEVERQYGPIDWEAFMPPYDPMSSERDFGIKYVRALSDDPNQTAFHTLSASVASDIEFLKVVKYMVESVVCSDNAINFSTTLALHNLGISHLATGLRVIRRIGSEPGCGGKDKVDIDVSTGKRGLEADLDAGFSQRDASEICDALERQKCLGRMQLVVHVNRDEDRAMVKTGPNQYTSVVGTLGKVVGVQQFYDWSFLYTKVGEDYKCEDVVLREFYNGAVPTPGVSMKFSKVQELIFGSGTRQVAPMPAIRLPSAEATSAAKSDANGAKPYFSHKKRLQNKEKVNKAKQAKQQKEAAEALQREEECEQSMEQARDDAGVATAFRCHNYPVCGRTFVTRGGVKSHNLRCKARKRQSLQQKLLEGMKRTTVNATEAPDSGSTTPGTPWPETSIVLEGESPFKVEACASSTSLRFTEIAGSAPLAWHLRNVADYSITQVDGATPDADNLMARAVDSKAMVLKLSRVIPDVVRNGIAQTPKPRRSAAFSDAQSSCRNVMTASLGATSSERVRLCDNASLTPGTGSASHRLHHGSVPKQQSAKRGLKPSMWMKKWKRRRKR